MGISRGPDRIKSALSNLGALVIKAIHGPEGGLITDVRRGFRSTWTSIVQEVKKLQNQGVNIFDYIRIKIGNGDNTSFGKDKWHKRGVQTDQIPSSVWKELSTRQSLQDWFSPITPHLLLTRWVKSVPLKVNIMAWKIKMDGLPTRMNISRRGIEIDSIVCPICNSGAESSCHIFFQCNLVRQLARKISSWWNVDYVDVSSYEEWYI
ncbi:RNA-directed DNA polymerase, eukaryota [Tanacetum coccineum]